METDLASRGHMELELVAARRLLSESGYCLEGQSDRVCVEKKLVCTAPIIFVVVASFCHDNCFLKARDV